jgi:hypothetical protein
VLDRRAFVTKGALAAAGSAVGAGTIDALLPSFAAAAGKHGGVTKGDLAILGAAQIAEALAVTMYTGIVDDAPFFARLEADDQEYFKAARTEEMAHYLLERGVTRKPAGATTFYFPQRMFEDAQTTLNVLVTLEEAFIAAYLVGVRRFSSPDLRVTAARIMGIESDHRILARVVAPTLSIERVTGIQGRAELVDPPNNNTYERTLRWTKISKAVDALTPFIDKRAAGRAGFDTSRPFRFAPFTPQPPTGAGDFHSFIG